MQNGTSASQEQRLTENKHPVRTGRNGNVTISPEHSPCGYEIPFGRATQSLYGKTTGLEKAVFFTPRQSGQTEWRWADRTVIVKHIGNIYKTKELHESATCAKIAQLQSEGGRNVLRKVNLYSLDMIISVGYRVNSVNATRFRQWGVFDVCTVFELK